MHARRFVHVVEEIPVTTWYRPITAPLKRAGLPQPGEQCQAWGLDEARERYLPLTDAAHRRLLQAAA